DVYCRAAVGRIPDALSGYRIVQISDFHIGSFVGTGFVERVVREAMALEPDLVVFTGDIVNFGSAELLPHVDVLSGLHARDGVYAIMGNHDYGDYVGWESAEAKAANLRLLKETYARMGWRLLDNRSLWIVRGGDSLRLAGVENWGGGHRFPKYGNLDAALAGTACAIDTAAARPDFCRAGFPHVYTVLLSHDPSHFDSIVAPRYPQVDLCLSGHTHGMQLGIRIGGKDYTAARRMYRHDAGLYTIEDGRRLYVNTGVGFNGAPFRVGIRPRIVLLEL
ncbi:MAG: metallophosphoesterase, partial [Bacteroidales bacterium]|nr:metallophosphoesterase [Bacteroidales bacterium]